jgi:HD-GYP domain-containing protein (c-di-GMP phosphodiesterase class II)
MNTVSFNQLAPNKFFSEDSYLFEDLFFLPKNLPLMEFHINILKMWNIDKIYSNGILLDAQITSVKDKENTESHLEDLFDSPDNIVDIYEKSDDDIIEPIIIDSPSDFKSLYRNWIVTTIGYHNSIITSKNVDKEKVVNLLNEIKDAIRKNRNESLKQFGRPIEGIPYMHRKTIETTILAYILSESTSLTDFASTNLMFATLYHDLGMLKVPKEILQKKSALTKEDVLEIQNHTIYGYKYLRETGYSAIIASGALQHHERIDGKGYPNHVTNEKITDIAKIIAVVDAYCAAISGKPFKDPLHAKEAVQDLLKSGGTSYDANILKELVKNISFYPIGSFIVLSNGINAEVSGTSGVAMRPIVKTINKEGYGETIDLSKRNDVYIKGIYTKTSE